MSHLNVEDQLDLALGSPVDPIVPEHLRTCELCRTEQAVLQRTVDGVRGSAAETLEDPPSSIWAAIASEVDGDITSSSPIEQAPPERHSQSPTNVRALRAPTRRWAGRALLAAACLVGVALGSIGTVAWTNRAPTGTMLAAAELTPLDSGVRLGQADLIAIDGHVDLRLQLSPVDPGSGFLEVWLINKDLKRMVSIGIIPPGSTQTELRVTRQLIDQGYTVVDVSREAFDDKPQHSGDSLARGALPI